MRFLLFWMALAFLGNLPAAVESSARSPDERSIWKMGALVQVQYAFRPAGTKTWSHANTSLKGAASESMLQNQLSARHVGAESRVLSARVGSKPGERLQVRYQFRVEK